MSECGCPDGTPVGDTIINAVDIRIMKERILALEKAGACAAGVMIILSKKLNARANRLIGIESLLNNSSDALAIAADALNSVLSKKE